MQRRILVYLIAFMAAHTAAAQQVVKCDVDLLGRIEVNVQGLTKKEIKDFLYTFDPSCASNAEYSEFSNELLFEVLYEQTSVVIKLLESEKSKIDIDTILNDLSAPINDALDVDLVLARVIRTKDNGTMKTLIIQRLKDAQAKSKKP